MKPQMTMKNDAENADVENETGKNTTQTRRVYLYSTVIFFLICILSLMPEGMLSIQPHSELLSLLWEG